MRAAFVLIVVGTALATGGAQAQTVATEPAGKPLDLASPRTSFAVRYEPASEPRLKGVAKTSVERRLADDRLNGSMGFMCGLHPGAETRGGAAMRGYDPTGRFVGARLSLTFR